MNTHHQHINGSQKLFTGLTSTTTWKTVSPFGFKGSLRLKNEDKDAAKLIKENKLIKVPRPTAGLTQEAAALNQAALAGLRGPQRRAWCFALTGWWDPNEYSLPSQFTWCFCLPCNHFWNRGQSSAYKTSTLRRVRGPPLRWLHEELLWPRHLSSLPVEKEIRCSLSDPPSSAEGLRSSSASTQGTLMQKEKKKPKFLHLSLAEQDDVNKTALASKQSSLNQRNIVTLKALEIYDRPSRKLLIWMSLR